MVPGVFSKDIGIMTACKDYYSKLSFISHIRLHDYFLQLKYSKVRAIAQ